MLINNNNNNNKAAAGKKKRGKRLEKKICVYVVGTTLAEMVYAEKYVQKQRFTRAYVDTVKRENKKSEDSAEEKTLACESAQKKNV